MHERIRALDAALAAEPSRAEWWLERADFHRIDGAYTNALSDLAAAERHGKALKRLPWVRARVFAEMGRAEEAKGQLDRWLAVEPGHTEALALRAGLRADSGDAVGAVEDYTAAIRAVEKPAPDLILARARVQRKVGKEGLERALVGVEDGIRALGPLVILQMEAAELEEALGRVDAAAARLDCLVRTAVRPESWRVRKAELLERAGRAGAAKAEWRQALEHCVALSPRLRGSRAQQALEGRIREKLGPLESASVDRARTPRGDAADDSAAKTISQTVPPLRNQPVP